MDARILTILFSLIIVPSTSRLLCGVELATSNLMEMFIKLDCPNLYEQHKKCCEDHGVCYVFQEPRRQCDKDYCECVYKIAGKAGGICQIHGENYCKIVEETGRFFYHMYGR